MTQIQPEGFLDIDDARLEYRFVGPDLAKAPTLVLLHEGLGSVALWGDFPERLSASTGAGVFAYSRRGYGKSSKVPLPRPLDYMEREALDVLPKVLDAISFRRGMLVGHSDGASIAAIYLGNVQDHRMRGLSLIAPHFFVEDMNVRAISAVKLAYETTDLKQRLAKYHDDVDGAFYGWNGAWLDPKFKTWDISDALGYIRVPVQIIQGDADTYGTTRQIEIAEAECYCPVDVTMLPGIGHSPHREAPEATLRTVSGFCNRILTLHREGQMPVAA